MAGQFQGTVAEQLAALAIERIVVDSQCAGAGMLHRTSRIAQLGSADGQITIAGDGAAVVVGQNLLHQQRAGISSGSQQRAAFVVEGICRDGETFGIQAGTTVIDRICTQHQSTCAADAAVAPFQLVRRDGQRTHTAVADVARGIEQVRSIQMKVVTIAGNSTATVVEATTDSNMRISAASRAEHTRHIGQRTGLDILRAIGGDGAGIIGQVITYLQ